MLPCKSQYYKHILSVHFKMIKQFKHSTYIYKMPQNSTSNENIRTRNTTERHWNEDSAQGTSLDIWRHGLDPPWTSESPPPSMYVRNMENIH